MFRLEVESSSIAAVGYVPGLLEVEFKHGGVFEYLGVPPQVCLALLCASSKGRFLNQYIVGRYRCRRLGAGS